MTWQLIESFKTETYNISDSHFLSTRFTISKAVSCWSTWVCTATTSLSLCDDYKHLNHASTLPCFEGTSASYTPQLIRQSKSSFLMHSRARPALSSIIRNQCFPPDDNSFCLRKLMLCPLTHTNRNNRRCSTFFFSF